MRPCTLPTRRACRGTRQPKAANGAANPRLADRSRPRPRERSRTAGQRLSHVDVAPNRLAVSSRGESAPRVATRLHNPRPLLVARKLHVPSYRLELLETDRDCGELGDLFSSQSRHVGSLDVDLLNATVAHYGGSRPVRDRRLDEAAARGEATELRRRDAD